jgi:acetoacetate decarboxylase
MGFIKSSEEIQKKKSENPQFYEAEGITVYFMTKPEIVKKLLPPPLKPIELPLGLVFIANYPKTNFCPPYFESALSLFAEYNGEQGIFIVAMPVTNDIALILGREVYGYPKKIADIHLEKEGNQVKGWTERHGVRFLDLRAKLDGKFNNENAQQMITERIKSNPDVIVYNYKFFPAPEGRGFDYNPRLMQETVTRKFKKVEFGKAELILKSSKHDPWGDVEIEGILGATYAIFDMSMLPGKIVAEVDQAEFAPYGYMKLDNFEIG